eukprot:jgi/Mesen1/2555/ME000162S01679
MEATFKAARSSGSLNLANRGLRDVPAQVFTLAESIGPNEKWWEVVDLQKLVMSHNSLQAIPEDLGTLVALTSLDVSYNELASLPSSLGLLENLKSLLVSTNQMEELPDEIGQLSILASGNRLARIPASIGNCAALSELKLGGNQIERLPLELASCRNLATLELQNKLQELPGDVGHLKKLVRLDVQQNRLQEVPPQLGACGALAELYLGSNELRALPEELATLHALGTLVLSANQLAEVPASICQLSLQTLDLSDNNLASLPALLGNMTSLRRLVLTGNPLKSLRSALVAGPTLALLKYLRSRLPASSADDNTAATSGNLFGAGIEGQVSAASREASTSGVLALRGKSLTEVPMAAVDADTCRVLDLSSNAIAALPPSLASCSSLELPEDAFKALFRLEALDLSGAPGALPPPLSVAPLAHLRELRLSNMRLPAVPAGVEHLAELRVLDLSQNCIEEVPLGLTQLAALEELNLANNSDPPVRHDTWHAGDPRVSSRQDPCLGEDVFFLYRLM